MLLSRILQNETIPLSTLYAKKERIKKNEGLEKKQRHHESMYIAVFQVVAVCL